MLLLPFVRLYHDKICPMSWVAVMVDFLIRTLVLLILKYEGFKLPSYFLDYYTNIVVMKQNYEFLSQKIYLMTLIFKTAKPDGHFRAVSFLIVNNYLIFRNITLAINAIIIGYTSLMLLKFC